MPYDFGCQVEPLQGRKTPDKIILGLPRARYLRSQRQRTDGDVINIPLAIAPGVTTGILQKLRPTSLERQPRRRNETTHPGREQVIGADKATGPVRDSDRDIVMVHSLT